VHLRRYLSDVEQVLSNRKAMCTTSFIVVLYSICWLPYSLYEGFVFILDNVEVINLKIELNNIQKTLFLLVLFNSLLDPFIYAVRMREIQRGLLHWRASNATAIAFRPSVCLSVCHTSDLRLNGLIYRDTVCTT